MAELKKEILHLIEDELSLQGKVFISVAPEQIAAPYVVITEASSDPLETVAGSLPYGTLDINIFHPEIPVCEQLYERVKNLLNKCDVGDVRCYYTSDKIDFYPDYELYNKVLTIKFL